MCSPLISVKMLLDNIVYGIGFVPMDAAVISNSSWSLAYFVRACLKWIESCFCYLHLGPRFRLLMIGDAFEHGVTNYLLVA
jgi:hypothetical protein